MILIPKFSNVIQLGGAIALAHYNQDGELIDDRFYSNIVVTVGKNWIAGRMKDTTTGGTVYTIPAQMGWMAVGGATGTGAATAAKTTPVVGDSYLTVQASGPTLGELGRVALSNGGGTTGPGAVSGAVVTYTATFPAGTGTGALIEAGIFNATGAAAGTMLCKTAFDVVNKAANDSIAITWTVTIQ